jgi:AraC family transcriptional regulator
MNRLNAVLMFFVLSLCVAAFSWAQTAGTAPAAPPDTTAAEALPEVELKVDTAFAYVALEMTGSYEQHEEGFTLLYEEAAKQNIFGGMPFGVYWNSPSDTPVEKLSWDVGFVAPPGAAPKPPLKLKPWKFTIEATLRYTGSFGADMDRVYGRLYQWIGENGYRPAGPMMEIFLNTPSREEAGQLFGTVEIVVPVEKLKPAPTQGVKSK